MQEIWKEIYFYDHNSNEWIDYRGKYQVSSLGRYRNVRNGHILTPGRISQKQYLRVHLENRFFRAHKPVIYMFPEICGEWFEGATCNHKDEDPTNNAALNLEWLSVGDNIRYGTGVARAHKTQHEQWMIKNGYKKVPTRGTREVWRKV